MTDTDFDCYDKIATPVFVLDVDDNGIPRYAFFNASAQELSGRSAADVLGKTAREVFAGRFGETAFAHQLKATRSAEQARYELELPVRDGTRWYHTTLEPVCDGAGKVVRLIGTSIDFTSNQTALELKASMQTASSEVEQFVAMAAHDLRAPMRNVRLLTEMLREDFEDHGDGKLDLINMLEDVACKSADLISEVLGHVQAAALVPDESTFDFGTLCQSMCAVLDPRGHHQIAWTAATVSGDKTAFQIVLRNLIENAIKHGGKEEMEIDVTLGAVSDKAVSVTVTDDGRGFSNPAVAFLETGRFRVDSGYGLLGIRRLIHARGGTITVHSKGEGLGSSIQFTLPGTLMQAPRQATPVMAPYSRAATG